MAKIKQIKNLKGKKLTIKVGNPEMERMRQHSNELQDKVKELVKQVNSLSRRI